MNKFRFLILLFMFVSCGDELTSPLNDATINITDYKGFELEVNTWSPDKQMGWSTIGGAIVVYFQSGRYSQNKSNKTFETNQFVHRGVVLYQYVEDEVTILGLGEGKVLDGFDKLKAMIYPDDVYRHISRIDCVEIVNVGTPVYYSNYWYVGEFDSSKVFNKDLGKVFGKKVSESVQELP